MTSAQPIKILIMRLLNVADVAAIAVPAIRYYQAQYPQAEITFLSFGQGNEIVELAEPNVKHINLGRQDWPDAGPRPVEGISGFEIRRRCEINRPLQNRSGSEGKRL